jgi:hypothetical protein
LQLQPRPAELLGGSAAAHPSIVVRVLDRVHGELVPGLQQPRNVAWKPPRERERREERGPEPVRFEEAPDALQPDAGENEGVHIHGRAAEVRPELELLEVEGQQELDRPPLRACRTPGGHVQSKASLGRRCRGQRMDG